MASPALMTSGPMPSAGREAMRYWRVMAAVSSQSSRCLLERVHRLGNLSGGEGADGCAESWTRRDQDDRDHAVQTRRTSTKHHAVFLCVPLCALWDTFTPRKQATLSRTGVRSYQPSID